MARRTVAVADGGRSRARPSTLAAGNSSMLDDIFLNELFS
jgi:hypothetical protein